MKIKDIWNKFLELRKSPVCFLFSLVGLLNALVLLYILVFTYTPVLYNFGRNIYLVFYFIARFYYEIFYVASPYCIIIFLFIFGIVKIDNLTILNK